MGETSTDLPTELSVPPTPASTTNATQPISSRQKSTLQNIKSYFRNYTWCTMLVSTAGLLFGFDTSSIGPITVMPSFRSKFSPISPTLQGLIVSSILTTASLFSFLAGHISDRISRTYTISIGCTIFSLGCVLEASAPTLPVLIAGRCISGVGEGLFLSTVTVYTCEIAPAALRGRLACVMQLFITFGIAGGYFVCYGTVPLSGDFSWRFPFTMQAVLAFSLAVAIPFLPHSPRWLKHVNRQADAERSWATLGFTRAEAEKEEEVSQRAVQAEETATVTGAEKKRWWQQASMMFARDVRLRTMLGCFLMAMQQACGIDGVLYYAPVLFSQAGLTSSTASFLASGVSGLLNVACTIVALFFMDKWGRRPSMIYGGSIISLSMLSIGILYSTHGTDAKAGKFAVIVLIYIFVIAFSMSWAVVNRIYCSEIQPMRTRASATSLGQCANWIVNFLIALSTPLFLSRSSSGPYFLFGGCTLTTVLVCVMFQPESKGLSLEELDGVFRGGSPWRRIVHSKMRFRRGTSGGEEEGIVLRRVEAIH